MALIIQEFSNTKGAVTQAVGADLRFLGPELPNRSVKRNNNHITVALSKIRACDIVFLNE